MPGLFFNDSALARRALLQAAAIGVGSGLMQSSAETNASGADAPVWSSEYWAKKGEVRLNLWRKRSAAPQAGEQPLPVLFLVHGSSNSARTSFDLTAPGKGEYSLM